MEDAQEYVHHLIVSKFPLIPEKLKPKQEEVVQSVLSGKNTCAILPTGYGKSLTYVLPALWKEGVALVISPLKALQDNQLHSLKRWGVNAAVINEDTEVDSIKKGVEEKNFHVILATPEAATGDQWRDIMQEIAKDVCLVCFDEAHVVATWGNQFRDAYLLCGELRSVFARKPFLLLTATLPFDTKAEVLRILNIREGNLTTISASLDRTNISLIVKADPSMKKEMCLNGLVKRISESRDRCPKCVIFVGTIAAAVIVYKRLMFMLKEKAFSSHILCDRENLMVALFHAELEKDERSRVLDTFTTPDSKIRIVIATDAFSLGVHVDDLKTVIIWGTPRDIITFWQQAGRAGRNGQPSECLLFATRTTYHKKQSCIKDLAVDVMNNKVKCIRRTLLKFLGNVGDAGELSVPCCNFCVPNLSDAPADDAE